MFSASCKRGSGANTLSDPDDNGGYASDISRIELASNDVIDIADEAGTLYNGTQLRTAHKTLLGNCATVATDTTSIPHVLIVRFGDQDCTGLDGRKRKGSILISYNGRYTDSAQAHTITFDNYYINDLQVTGTITATRVDTTITGNWYYRVLVNETLTTAATGENVTWKGALVRKWISGFDTDDRTDDIFSISGNATITRANGHFFACDIATPLKAALNCDYIESGVVNVNGYTGVNTQRVLNYGAGNCDNIAQLNIGALVYQITLQQ